MKGNEGERREEKKRKEKMRGEENAKLTGEIVKRRT